MALFDTAWYCNFGNGSSTGYYAVTVRPQNAAVAAGVLRRQFTAPAVASERVFVCIVAGTTANVTDATWILTRGAKTTDGTATWMECTGQAALNGDLTNTATWAQVKAATPAVLGQIIKRSNNASYQICTTAGAMSASEPSFSDTAGVTTTDTTAVWTSLGPVSNFTGGQAPFARLQSVFGTSWFAAGNTVYVGNNHAETQGSAMSFGPAGSASTVNKILCHNSSGSYPPASSDLTTGATVTTSSGNINLNATVGASMTYYNGIAFKSASTLLVTQTSGTAMYFDNCSLEPGGGQPLIFGNGGTSPCTCSLNNTTVKYASAASIINIQGTQLTWKNTGQILVSGSSVPTNLFGVAGQPASAFIVNLEALDLSQISTSLVVTSGAVAVGVLTIKDCKLHASATLGALGSPGMSYQLIRSDSGATAYKSTRYAYEGTETTETSITRVGGAQDPTGQAQSRKIVTNTLPQWIRPFQAEPYSIWNATTGANVTVTIYGTINAGAVPNNDDIWLDVEYLGSSATPLGTIVTTTKATLLAANAAVASDGSSWNGGGSGAGWSPFKLTTTLSSPQPGMAGYIDVRVRAAKVSTTYYVDPKIELT